MKRITVLARVGLCACILGLGSISMPVHAQVLESDNFRIDAFEVGGNFAGRTSSDNYTLVATGSSTIMGNAEGGSYKLGEGYVAQLVQSMQVVLIPDAGASVDFPPITPGSSEVAGMSVFVETDGPSYGLYAEQDHDLQSGANTIDPVSGTIGTPVSWTEGTTKGLGFTLVGGTNSIPGTWGTNPNYNYAAIPDTGTLFYTRDGYTGGAEDELIMQFRLDVDTTQPAGSYQNTLTITGTLIP